MAISRDQPMRPALDDVMDVVDAQWEGIMALAALLPVTDFTDESTVAAAIAAEATAREGLAALLPSTDFTDESTVAAAIAAIAALLPATDFTDENTVAAAIAASSAWYRKGRESVTVPPLSSETVTVNYGEAFDAGTICMTTHALDATSASDTDVTVTLDSSDETGLEFTVANANASDPKTVTIGYFTTGV